MIIITINEVDYSELVDKLRAKYKNDTLLRRIINEEYEISFEENRENHNIVFKHIYFSDGYDIFIVTDSKIIYSQEYGKRDIIVEYNSLIEFLQED